MSISPRSDENNGFHFLTQAHGAGLKQSWEMSSSSSLSITAVCFLLFSSLFSSNVTYLRHRTSNQGAQHPSLADKNVQVRSWGQPARRGRHLQNTQQAALFFPCARPRFLPMQIEAVKGMQTHMHPDNTKVFDTLIRTSISLRNS